MSRHSEDMVYLLKEFGLENNGKNRTVLEERVRMVLKQEKAPSSKIWEDVRLKFKDPKQKKVLIKELRDFEPI